MYKIDKYGVKLKDNSKFFYQHTMCEIFTMMGRQPRKKDMHSQGTDNLQEKIKNGEVLGCVWSAALSLKGLGSC